MLIRMAGFAVLGITAASLVTGGVDADQDGLVDASDACPVVLYLPGFAWSECEPTDQDPGNDVRPECKARERIIQMLVDPGDGALILNIAFAVVKDGSVYFADAFTYLGQGQYAHDPDGVNRLYRVGSTSKSVIAATATVLEEAGALSMDDFVNDDDATQVVTGGQRTLRQLLSHQGAFKLDIGAINLFCYPGDLAAFWAEPDDLISPHYDSATYGNLGGGFEYSAFNYSLAGAYLTQRTGETLADLIQTRIFDAAGMCTATLDGSRAVTTPIGDGAAISQSSSMHTGPYINLVSPSDPLCDDNFYSSDDVYGDAYSYQYYRLDEAAAEARDPAGGVIASVIDLGHFGRALLDSYAGVPGSLMSPAGVTELWEATSDLGCHPGCPYARYYGIGFFTETLPGETQTEVGHGGSRAGYKSAFVLRPQVGLAVAILVNADASTVTMSDLAKTILDDFEAFGCAADLDGDGLVGIGDFLGLLAAWGTGGNGAAIAAPFDTVDISDLLALLAAWGDCG